MVGKKSKSDINIIADGNVAFKDVSGQIAIGNYITQIKIENPSSEELVNLINNLELSCALEGFE